MSYSDGIKFRDKTSIPTGGNGFMGGSERDDSVTPMTKGYFFAFFAFPGHIFKDGMSAVSAKAYLLNQAVDFQPHADRQLQTIEDKGVGNTTSNFIVGQQTTQDFSITFKETAAAPIYRVHAKWTSYIDPYLGASTIADTFAPSEYKGSVMVIQTKPIARITKGAWQASDIIKISLYEGVFPLPDPSSPFANGIEQSDRVQIPIQYKFDGQPLNETNSLVLSQALEILNNQDIYNSTQDIYTALSSASKIKSGINAS